MGKPEGPSCMEQSTLWSAASPNDPARTCPSPARERASRKGRGAGSGSRCVGSSESADPVGYSLRTSLLSALTEATGFSLTWKHSATPAGRSWWVLGRSGLRIGGNGCGSSGDWQTPTVAPMVKGCTYTYDGGDKTMPRPSLLGQVLWPTLMAGNEKWCGSPLEVGGASARRIMRDSLGLPDPASRSTNGKNRGSVLNAKWVAQLMGYPPDWCDISLRYVAEMAITSRNGGSATTSKCNAAPTATPSAPTGTPSSPRSSRPSDGGS
jgi:hypothetical protein